MTAPTSEIQSLQQDALIELYTLDLSTIGTAVSLRFCNFSQTNGTSVTFQGQVFEPIPFEVEGFEFNGRGQLPTPTLRVSNVLSVMTPLLLNYQDLVGAKVIRQRTFAKHLDGGSQANPSMEFEPDIYYVERKIAENKLEVSFELASALDLGNFQLPARLILANLCPWKYRGAGCGYTGAPVADKNDRPTSDPNRDDCGKRVRSCELRFGRNNPLPYGGFSGAGQQGYS